MGTNFTPGTRVTHELYGEGIVAKVNAISYDIFFASGGKIEILKNSKDLSSAESLFDSDTTFSDSSAGSSSTPIDLDSLASILDHLLEKHGLLQEEVSLGNRWTGGKIIIQPAKPDLKPKEIPIEDFFHKIVILRDRLRVLEQQINGNTKLSDEEKVHLQQYITRIYGSLTTFNLLFRDKEQQFTGTSGKE